MFNVKISKRKKCYIGLSGKVVTIYCSPMGWFVGLYSSAWNESFSFVRLITPSPNIFYSVYFSRFIIIGIFHYQAPPGPSPETTTWINLSRRQITQNRKMVKIYIWIFFWSLKFWRNRTELSFLWHSCWRKIRISEG